MHGTSYGSRSRTKVVGVDSRGSSPQHHKAAMQPLRDLLRQRCRLWARIAHPLMSTSSLANLFNTSAGISGEVQLALISLLLFGWYLQESETSSSVIAQSISHSFVFIGREQTTKENGHGPLIVSGWNESRNFSQGLSATARQCTFR
jgi:hypothetical protein